jgi:hypothetical protein
MNRLTIALASVFVVTNGGHFNHGPVNPGGQHLQQ